jgi:hypothetical protein
MMTHMFMVYVTLANGNQVSGCIDARDYATAQRMVAGTEQARTALRVEIESTY